MWFDKFVIRDFPNILSGAAKYSDAENQLRQQFPLVRVNFVQIPNETTRLSFSQMVFYLIQRVKES